MIDELLLEVPDCHGIFDTHAHYDDSRFDRIKDTLLEQLHLKGVTNIITCGCDLSSSESAIRLAERHDFVYAAVGYHPENLEPEPNLTKLKQLLMHKKVVALGEIGLDYHWDIDKGLQHKWFEEQLKLSLELDIPVIVHDREAHEDCLKLLKKYKPKGVMHCFSGSVETAKEILKLGLYIGLGGVVTFKNARKTVEVAEMLPLDRMLLETDCPYLAPVPFRGKTCHSGHIAFVAERIAQIRGTSTEEILSVTNNNAKRLFLKQE